MFALSESSEETFKFVKRLMICSLLKFKARDVVCIGLTFVFVIGGCGVVIAMVFVYVEMMSCCSNGFGASVLFNLFRDLVFLLEEGV